MWSQMLFKFVACQCSRHHGGTVAPRKLYKQPAKTGKTHVLGNLFTAALCVSPTFSSFILFMCSAFGKYNGFTNKKEAYCAFAREETRDY